MNPLLVEINVGDTVYIIKAGKVMPLHVFKVLPDGVKTVLGELLFDDYKKTWWRYKSEAEAVLNGQKN